MPAEQVELSLIQAIVAVAISDISLTFDNALAISQMAIGLPPKQQHRALIIGMLLSCVIMIVMTFVVVQLREHFDWVRYPAGLWLLYVVVQLWFQKPREHKAHEVNQAMVKAIVLITLTDLAMAADNAIANSEFGLRAAVVDGVMNMSRLWSVLLFGLLISCVFMIGCTYAIVWIRRFADWIRYPAGAWLLWVAYLILSGKGHHAG
jgi:predicted tellurium resistance membrane protein TerC